MNRHAPRRGKRIFLKGVDQMLSFTYKSTANENSRETFFLVSEDQIVSLKSDNDKSWVNSELCTPPWSHRSSLRSAILISSVFTIAFLCLDKPGHTNTIIPTAYRDSFHCYLGTN